MRGWEQSLRGPWGRGTETVPCVPLSGCGQEKWCLYPTGPVNAPTVWLRMGGGASSVPRSLAIRGELTESVTDFPSEAHAPSASPGRIFLPPFLQSARLIKSWAFASLLPMSHLLPRLAFTSLFCLANVLSSHNTPGKCHHFCEAPLAGPGAADLPFLGHQRIL